MAKILIVDDDRSIRRTLKDILEFEKYEVHEAEDGLTCLVKVKQEKYDIIILDIKMPKMDGMDAIDRLQEICPDIPVIMISGHGDIDTAVEAVKKGAFDFLSKPPDLNRLLITVRNGLDKSTLIVQKKTLQKKVRKSKVAEIVGDSPEINVIKETIEKVAPTDARVLIQGPNGTGKELVARWLHERSARKNGPMVEVNCAAIPSELIESELFGHEKGSFTSAHKQRIGKFELANKGTLFLDEIGDMSLSAQAKVLRVLQESRIMRVGGEKELTVDVRVVAATNKDLRKEIAMGNFREDLFHRLAVIILRVPSLNKRREDIPQLVQHFNNQICKEYGIPAKIIDAGAITELKKINWTGNIRELRNVVERLIILSKDAVTKKNVVDYATKVSNTRNSMDDLFDKFDSFVEVRDYLEKEYEKYKSMVH
jgi:DNA-binding NtrC family response regulator